MEEIFGGDVTERKPDNRTGKELIDAVLARRCTTEHHLRVMHDAGLIDLLFDEAAQPHKVGLVREGLGYEQLISKFPGRKSLHVDYDRLLRARVRDLKETAEHYDRDPGAAAHMIESWRVIEKWAEDYPGRTFLNPLDVPYSTWRITRTISKVRKLDELAHARCRPADIHHLLEYLRVNYKKLMWSGSAVHIQNDDCSDALGVHWVSWARRYVPEIKKGVIAGDLLVVPFDH